MKLDCEIITLLRIVKIVNLVKIVKLVNLVNLSETCNSLVTILIIGTMLTVVKIRHSEHLASMPGKILGKYVPEFPLNRLKTLIGCFPISVCNEKQIT